MPTYARREGGAYARGEPALAGRLWSRYLAEQPMHGHRRDLVVAAFEVLAHGDVEAGRAVDHLRAERAHQRGLVLRRLELDEAHHARRAPVVHQLETVDWTIGLAQAEHVLRQRVQIARLAQPRYHVVSHVENDARAHPQQSISSKT